MEAEWKKTLEDGTEVVRTCAWSPPGCHPTGCGLKLFVKDGKLVKVEGDPDHPVTNGRLCVRCLTLPEYVYNNDRVIYPMKRAREDRGKADKWERVTWDEAYAIVKDETRKIQAKYGSEGIVVFSGTGRMGCMLDHMKSDLAMQTPNYCYTQSGWSCYGPRIAVTAFIAGAGVMDIDWAGSFPDRYNNPEFKLPEVIVLWGKDPLASNPDGFFGHSIIDMMKRGTKIVTVDPRMTWLSSRSEFALRLRPGTDAALALALLNVIITEGLYDKDWCDKWVYGWDQFKERCMEYPPEKVEEITWVPADRIRAAARLLGTAHPVSYAWGLAVDQNWNGVQVAQCIMALTACTGNLEEPGGNTLGVPSNVVTNPVGTFKDYIPKEIMEKRIGAKEYPAVIAAMDTVQPDVMLEVLETDKPYPIRMAVFGSSNLISPTCSAQPKRWHDALLKMEFSMATDTFMNPTIQAACDLFLPIATFAEYDNYVVTNYGINMAFIGAINKAIEVGEARSELQICLELAELLNPGKLPYPATIEGHLDHCVSESLGSFEELKKVGVYQPGQDYRKQEKGMLRPDGQKGFATPTGRLELYSTIYQSFGDDPLPYYEEPYMSPYSDKISQEDKEKYPLILTTGSRRYTSFHSEHRQVPTLRKLTPDPILEIHPKTAAKMGIQEGDWVLIENMFGQAKERAHLTPIIDPRVVNAAHGWWYPEEDGNEPHLYGNWTSNVNSLIPHRIIGKLGFGAPYKNALCRISKTTREEGE